MCHVSMVTSRNFWESSAGVATPLSTLSKLGSPTRRWESAHLFSISSTLSVGISRWDGMTRNIRNWKLNRILKNMQASKKHMLHIWFILKAKTGPYGDPRTNSIGFPWYPADSCRNCTAQLLRPPTVQSQNPHLLLQKRDVFSHVGPEAPNHSSYPHFNWNRKDNSQQLTWRPPSWSQTRQKEAPKQWGRPSGTPPSETLQWWSQPVVHPATSHWWAWGCQCNAPHKWNPNPHFHPLRTSHLTVPALQKSLRWSSPAFWARTSLAVFGHGLYGGSRGSPCFAVPTKAIRWKKAKHRCQMSSKQIMCWDSGPLKLSDLCPIHIDRYLDHIHCTIWEINRNDTWERTGHISIPSNLPGHRRGCKTYLPLRLASAQTSRAKMQLICVIFI